MSQSEDHHWPLLFKRTAHGDVQTWQIWVESRGDNCGVIHTVFGLQGGKQQHLKEENRSGANIGKRNETTPLQQAVLEAAARHKKQRERKGYGDTPEQSAAIRSVSPMLAQDIKKRGDKIDWSTAFAQPKLEGFRCLAFCDDNRNIELRSREGKLITTMDHIASELDHVVEPGEIFDGELYAHGMPFQEIASAIKRQKTRTDHADEIKYHVYDKIAPVRYEYRYEQIRGAMDGKFEHLVLVDTVVVRTRDELAVCEGDFLSGGYEGAMLRHGREGYAAGKRSSSLLKVKLFSDADFRIVDVREGRGTHKGMAIFICQTDKGHHFEVTAPGTHEEKRDAWVHRNALIDQMVTVKYQRWTTTAEPVPYIPTAVRIVQRA